MKSRTKCARSVCERRSADPKADGWTWIEFDPPPPKTGWWCPDCAAGVRAILATPDPQEEQEMNATDTAARRFGAGDLYEELERQIARAPDPDMVRWDILVAYELSVWNL